MLIPSAASAQSPAANQPTVEVVKVQGVLDPSVFGYVRSTLQNARRPNTTVVLQIDSRWGYDGWAAKLASAIRTAPAPVVAWVGPSGARAEGPAVALLATSPIRAIAPGAGVASMAAGPALRAGIVGVVAANVRDLLVKLDGRSVATGSRRVVLATLNRGGRQVEVRFHDMGPVRRILHAVSTPTAIYVLLVFALWGIAFELTQPGIGVAGIAAALALALAIYGLTVLPVSWLGIGLILAGTGLQALDVLIRRVGFLTVGGTLVFAAGSYLAWRDAPPAIDLALWLVVLATIGGALFFGFALTVALKARERVRTAQVGLVGLLGEARGDLDPEGAVFVKGTMWRGRSMNGPIAKGTRVRVRGIDGLVLRVEEEPE